MVLFEQLNEDERYEKAFKNLKFKDYEEVAVINREGYYRRKNTADKIFEELLKSDRYSRGTRLRDLVMDYE